jgi:hypothetical protein
MKNCFLALMAMIVQCSFGQVASDAPIDWTNAGYRGKTADIPRQFDRMVNIKTEFTVLGDGSTDDAPEIQRAINAYSDFTVYYFPAGTYYLGSTITLRSNCVVLGDGSSKTVFITTHSNSVFAIVGSEDSSVPMSPAADLVKDAQTITAPFSVSAGDFIEISAYDPSLVVSGDEAAWYYCIGQIVRVKQVNGSSMALDDKLRLNYSTLTPRAAKMHALVNVGFENFKVSNQSPAGSLNFSTNFNFNCAADCWILGVESQGSGFAHVNIGSSANIEIRGCYFHEAQDYGEGGHGYGINIGGHSSSCLIENNIFKKLRHAMIVSSGANGNVFGFNYSREVYSSWEPDMCFHGHYPFANLFEGNYGDFLQADLVWGVNGPYNAIFRNALVRMPTIMCGYETEEGGIKIDHQSGFHQHFYALGNAVRDAQYFLCGYKKAFYFDWADLDLEDGNIGLDKNTDGSFNNGERTSYYKDSRPGFISTAYTWPPLGCKYSGNVPSRTIPARDRWNAGGVLTVPSSPLYSASSLFTVSGTVNYGGTGVHPIGNVTVTLAPVTGTAFVTSSNATTGTYEFNNIIPAGTYTLTASKTGDWGGVNATDALLVARHSAGIALLTGLPLKAADVNNSGSVTVTDPQAIVRRAAALDTAFAAGDWVFQSQTVTIVTTGLTEDITGLAVGDVNASYTPYTGTVFTKSTAFVDLSADAVQNVAPVGTFDIPVRLTSEMVFGAITMKVNFPADLVRFEGVSSTLEDIVSHAEEGSVNISWVDVSGKKGAQFKPHDALITLRFSAKAEKGSVRISIDPASEFVDEDGAVIADVKLLAPITEITNIPTVFSLGQNYPNPFNPSTTIQYGLPARSSVRLVIYNILGQVVKELVNAEQQAGYQTVVWNANVSSGLYFYRLEGTSLDDQSKKFVDTKKMLLLR